MSCDVNWKAVLDSSLRFTLEGWMSNSSVATSTPSTKTKPSSGPTKKGQKKKAGNCKSADDEVAAAGGQKDKGAIPRGNLLSDCSEEAFHAGFQLGLSLFSDPQANTPYLEQLTTFAEPAGGAGGAGKAREAKPAIRMSMDDKAAIFNVDAAGTMCSATSPQAWGGGRANICVKQGKYFFEVVCAKVKGTVRVGFSTAAGSYNLGTCPNGFGYGGTAKKSNSKQFVDYGSPYSESDCVGCYLDLAANQVGFTLNGADQGVAFDLAPHLKEQGIYPAICVKCAAVSVNFGAIPFKFPPPAGFSALAQATASHVNAQMGHNMPQQNKMAGGAGNGGMYSGGLKMNGGSGMHNMQGMPNMGSMHGNMHMNNTMSNMNNMPLPPGLQNMASGAFGDRGRKSAGGIDVSKLLSIDQVTGQVYNLSRDQLGCRFLQKQLEDDTQQSLQVIFNEVMDHMVELMTDPFGNYLCQKLLDCCTRHQRAAIVERVAQHLVSISLNIHGTRAAQKLIERLGSEHQPSLPEIEAVVDALQGGVVKLIQDLNGLPLPLRAFPYPFVGMEAS
jgi:hypothetical protein